LYTDPSKERVVLTIQDIEQVLPNGFHDSTIIGLRLNYVTRTAEIDLEILISGPDDAEDSEDYRPSTLSISELVYFVIEPPDSRYLSQSGTPLLIDGGSTEPEQSASPLPKPLPAGAFTYSFFVHEWNSFIHVAALRAELVVPAK